MSRERKQWLRENLPEVANVVDVFAAEFGRESIRVIYAKEAAHEFGKPLPGGVKLSETLVGLLAKPEMERRK